MKKVAVFCGSSLGFSSVYKEEAQKLGEHLAKQNIGLVYGAGKIGMMGVIADAMMKNNGKVYGIIPELLKHEEVMHDAITEVIITKTMSERKVLMSKMVDGYITLAGGFGTLDEIFEVLTLSQLGIERKPIGLLNTNRFFDAILTQLDVMVQEGFLKPTNKEMLIVASTIEELLDKMNTYIPPKVTEVINKVVK